jgi:hypothetical protein
VRRVVRRSVSASVSAAASPRRRRARRAGRDAVAHERRDAADAVGHHRQAARHRLDEHAAELLVLRRQDEDVGVPQVGRHLLVRGEPSRWTRSRAGEAATAGVHLRPQGTVADHDQVDLGTQQGVGRDGVERSLLVGQAPGEQHPRVRHVRGRVVERAGEQLGVEAGRHDVHAGRVGAVLDGRLGGELGEDEDRVGAAHDAALDGRADQGERASAPRLDRARHAAVERDDQRHARAPGDQLGQRQHGEVLALVGVHQPEVGGDGPPGQLAHGVGGPQLADGPQPRPGADHGRRPAEAGPGARPAEARGEDVLGHPEPVQAAGELGRVVLHPADRVVRRGVGPCERLGRRLEDRAQPQDRAADRGRVGRARCGSARSAGRAGSAGSWPERGQGSGRRSRTTSIGGGETAPVQSSASQHRASPSGPLLDPSVRSLLLVRLRVGLGDLLCTVPAVRALRAARPDLHVALATWPEMAGVVARTAPWVDELVRSPGRPASGAGPDGTLPQWQEAMAARAGTWRCRSTATTRPRTR